MTPPASSHPDGVDRRQRRSASPLDSAGWESARAVEYELMASRTAVVTGAFSFTGRFIARELIARGWSVRTLPNSRYPGDPLANEVAAHPLDFSRPEELV